MSKTVSQILRIVPLRFNARRNALPASTARNAASNISLAACRRFCIRLICVTQSRSNGFRGLPNVRDTPLRSQDLSFHSDQRPQLAKLPIADTAHHHQVLSTAKAPILFSVGDDSLGKHGADSRKSFELGGRGGVEIYRRWFRRRAGSLNNRRSV